VATGSLALCVPWATSPANAECTGVQMREKWEMRGESSGIKYSERNRRDVMLAKWVMDAYMHWMDEMRDEKTVHQLNCTGCGMRA
jgi:hypothetical protein